MPVGVPETAATVLRTARELLRQPLAPAADAGYRRMVGPTGAAVPCLPGLARLLARRTSSIALGSLVLFATLCVVFLGKHGSSAPAKDALWNSGTSIGAVTAAAVTAAYSFLGFDAVCTLGEEARGGARTIGRGIIGCVIAAGAIFIVLPRTVHPRRLGGSFRLGRAPAWSNMKAPSRRSGQ
ncbi:amino acid permease [Streptomyces canus]|uniref:amino acid permease n=1 Tax=Streptomyces canus TaxID=58343 RepID=UPI002E276568|nr:amino acid permease [Streptomyces canus]